MISNARQHSRLVRRLGKDAGNGDRTRHRTNNDEEVPFPLRCAPTTFRQSAGSLQSPLAAALGR